MSIAEEIDKLIRDTEVKVIEQAFSEHQGGCATETCGGNRLDPCRMASLLDRLEHLKTAPHAPGICVCSRTEKMYCAASDCHGGADILQWFERTWVDVRTGDTVRLPGSENTAHVRSAVHQKWHVDPRTGTAGWNPPVAMEWACVHVELTAGQEHDAAVLGVLDMDPAKPILIQMTQTEVDAIELLGGWPVRLGMIVTEVPQS